MPGRVRATPTLVEAREAADPARAVPAKELQVGDIEASRQAWPAGGARAADCHVGEKP
jgi:hypothetical protein